jgi:hypothetical protein
MTLLKVDAVDYDSVNQICIGYAKYVIQNKNKELKIIYLFQK